MSRRQNSGGQIGAREKGNELRLLVLEEKVSVLLMAEVNVLAYGVSQIKGSSLKGSDQSSRSR